MTILLIIFIHILLGQADLLSKIASLRGEVAALQGDLATNNRKLDESMSENDFIHSHKESLERQIEVLYARLSLSSPEKFDTADSRNMLATGADSASIKEYLAEVENERNLLLDYVQNDMEKSSAVEKEKAEIVSQLEMVKTSEAELRKELSAMRSARKGQSMSSSPKSQPSDRHPRSPLPPSSPSSAATASVDYKRNYEAIKEELNAVKLSLSRKESEAEELSKMQIELLQQMKEKEMQLQKTIGDLKIAKRAVSSSIDANESNLAVAKSPSEAAGALEATTTINRGTTEKTTSIKYELDGALQKISNNEREIEHLKLRMGSEHHKITLKDQEIESLKFQLQTNQIKLAAKEKELEDLKVQPQEEQRSANTIAIVEERNQLAQEIEKLKLDLLNFKTIEQVLGELTEVLLAKLRSNEIKSTGSHAFGYMTSNSRITSPSLHTPRKHTSLDDYRSSSPHKSNVGHTGQNVVSSSQEHAVWAMLPQIRQLSLPLYECIQKLFLDYHTKELEVVEVNASVSSLERRLSEMEEEKVGFMSRERCAAQEAEAMQMEINKGKGYKAILEQLKYVLQSTPGALSGLGHVLPQSGADAATRFANKERNMFLSQDSLETGENVKNDLSGYVDDSIFASPSSKKFAGDNNDTILIDEIPEEHIPDVVARALMRNFKAVNALADARIELKNLKMERDQASNEIDRLNNEHSLLQKSYEALSNQFQHEFETRQMNEEKLGTDLEAALELVEKQNSLSLSFEAKIEALKRDRQVRAAQVNTLQQREDQNRKIIIGVLKDFWNEFSEVEFPRSVYVDMGLGLSSTRQLPVPNENERLPDAVRTLSDLLAKLFNALCRSRTGESVVDRSTWSTGNSTNGQHGYNNTNVGGRGKVNGDTGVANNLNTDSSMYSQSQNGSNHGINMSKTTNAPLFSTQNDLAPSGSFTISGSKFSIHDKLQAARSLLSSQRE